MSNNKLEFYDTDNVSGLTLQTNLLKNIEISKKMRNEIINLKKFMLDCSSIQNEECSNINSNDNTLILEKVEDDSIYRFYYDPIKNISNYEYTDEELDKEIINYLPILSSDDIAPIIFRIRAEILKDIYEFRSIIDSTDDSLLLGEIRKEIEFNNRKLDSINRLLCKNISDNSKLVEKKNKLIFISTNAGNYSIMKDLKNIPSDYYDSFKELLNSIIDGTFKNLKQFNTVNKGISGVSEVKNFKTRVVFDRINKDTFIILSIFMKDFDINKLYLESLSDIISNYRKNYDYYFTMANDFNYMQEQDCIQKELFDILDQRCLLKKRGDGCE